MKLPRLCWATTCAALCAAMLPMLSLLTLGACGGGGTSMDSGARDGGADSTPESRVVTRPDIPWAEAGAPDVMLAPCPEGWQEVTGGLVTECDPYPEGGAEECEAGEAHFPGEAACRPLGDPCPASDYAATLPAGGTILYVKAGAPPGDGSIDSPFAELSDVPWLTLDSGTTVALAKGSYRGALPLRAGVRVVGACSRATVLTGFDRAAAAVTTVVSRGEPAGIRNLSFVDVGRPAARVDEGRALEVDGVLVDGATAVGLMASGHGATLTITDTLVRATRPADGGDPGRGIAAQEGAQVDASRFIAADNEGAGLTAFDVGTKVTIADGALRGTRPEGIAPHAGIGLQVGEGAHLVGTRLLIRDNHAVGVLAVDEGTVVELSDSVSRNTQAERSSGDFGRGVGVQRGAHFEGSRLLIAENRDVGILVGDENTTATLSDVIVRDTRPRQNDRDDGRGIVVQVGAELEAARILVSANHDLGLLVDEGSTVRLSDAAIRDTEASELNAGWGRGIHVGSGSHVEGTRLVIAGNHEIGIFAATEGTSIALTDVLIEDTEPLSNGTGGKGLQLQHEARLDGTRLRIMRSRGIGVMMTSGAVAVLEDVVVENVLRTACASTTCPAGALGYGIGSAGSSVTVTGFEVRNAATCGVFVAPYEGASLPGTLDLSSGSVVGSQIGACVQVDGYDFGRLTRDVAYIENDTNLDSTTLPVPEPSPNL